MENQLLRNIEVKFSIFDHTLERQTFPDGRMYIQFAVENPNLQLNRPNPSPRPANKQDDKPHDHIKRNKRTHVSDFFT